MTTDDAIDEIMGNMDWDGIYNVMHYLNWQWNDRPVTVSLLKERAIRLLKDCANSGGYIATGGFRASFDGYSLRLAFEIDYWEANEYDESGETYVLMENP